MESPEDLDIISKHKKEKKELQNRIQGLKHSVPKNDKKRKKEVTAEIAKLESDMKERHRLELEELLPVITETEIVLNGIEPDIPKEENCELERKNNKAQRRREKKMIKEKERDERIALSESENLKGVRHIEAAKLTAILKKRDLDVYEVPSDGNCMYKALEHQLDQIDINITMESLRSQTAEFMRKNPHDFIPFLTNSKTGDMMTEDEFEDFCNQTATSTVWGGQIELRALSHILKRPIEVVQAEGPSVVIGEEYTLLEPLILSYHRHAFRSGEHYNSVVPLVPKEEEDISKDSIS